MVADEGMWMAALPQTTAVYVASKNVFALVGDVSAFEETFDTTALEVVRALSVLGAKKRITDGGCSR
jgi:hypothetical protein